MSITFNFILTFAFQKSELCFIRRKNSVVIETGYWETKDHVGFIVIYDEVAYISLQGHVWERPGEIIVWNSCSLVRKCTKTENVSDRAVVVLDDIRTMFERCSSSPAWNDGSERLSIQLSSSTIGAACTVGTCRSDGGGRGYCCVVLRIPLRGCFMWPFEVAGLGLRYRVTHLA